MNPRIFQTLVFFLAALCFLQNLAAQKNTLVAPEAITVPTASLKPRQTPEQARRLETFRIVWQQINDNYFDRTFGGLNWKNIKAEFEPRALNAKSDAELHMLLQEMINRLNKSHFLIIPPEVYQEFDRAKAEIEKQVEEKEAKEIADDKTAQFEEKANEKGDRTTHYGIGIDIRILAGQIVVTRIEKDSPAEKAGLKTGYIIEKINGVSLKSFLETFQKNKVYAKVYEKQTVGILLSLINSVSDKSPVNLSVIDENEQSGQFTINRELQKGEVSRIIPNLPPMLLTFEAKSLSEDIGYISFNTFALANVEKFCGAISQFKNKKAIVIDLRGNVGGNFGALFGISGLLTEKGFVIGTEINKFGKEARFIQPQIKNFKGKLVVLTDGQSYSAAEVFASGFQENKRAVVIGEKTSGSALPALTQTLPTGAVFLFPIANFQTPNGNFLEGRGVEPDVKISLDRKSLLAGKDAQLDAAVSFLNLEISKIPSQFDNNAGKNAEVNVKISAPKMMIGKMISTEKPVQEEKALSVIEDFVQAGGGREVLNKLKSFSASGTAEIDQSGTKIAAGFELYRADTNKFARILKIEGVGEIDEVFDGKNYSVQTNFMGDQKTPEFMVEEIALGANFKEILQMREIYPTLVFEGIFDRKGKKVNLIKAVTGKGVRVYFAFDVDTKLLLSRSGNFVETSFDDYRKVGEWLLPFTISESTVTYKLNQIKTNSEIDDNRFVQKASCFSKID